MVKIISKIKNRILIYSEKLRGFDFSVVIEPDKLGYDSSLVHRSSPSGGKHLLGVLSLLECNNQSIIDIGCGKGSAMKSMIELPFEQIHGIEISTTVADIASKNFRKIGDTRCKIYNIDATQFSEYEKYDFFYFYNPFPELIMNMVIKKIIDSLTIYKRNLTVIYNNPINHDVLIKNNFILTSTSKNHWGGEINIYVFKAED